MTAILTREPGVAGADAGASNRFDRGVGGAFEKTANPNRTLHWRALRVRSKPKGVACAAVGASVGERAGAAATSDQGARDAVGVVVAVSCGANGGGARWAIVVEGT